MVSTLAAVSARGAQKTHVAQLASKAIPYQMASCTPTPTPSPGE